MNFNKHLIKYPVVSEKASMLNTLNKYIFAITKEATAPEVKKAIEGLYKVNAQGIARDGKGMLFLLLQPMKEINMKTLIASFLIILSSQPTFATEIAYFPTVQHFKGKNQYNGVYIILCNIH